MKPRVGELIGVHWDIPETRPSIEGDDVDRLILAAMGEGAVRLAPIDWSKTVEGWVLW